MNELTNHVVKTHYPFACELYASLPATLSREEILQANSKKHDIAQARTYIFDGMEFAVPPQVFAPGGTSEALFRLVQSGRIDVAGKTVGVMGCGAGVETVLMGQKSAKAIYAFDIDHASVAATQENYASSGATPPLKAVVSDLFQALEPGVRFDVIAFNPPAVSVPISDEPAVVRNTSVGATIMTRFFQQICDKELLGREGKVITVLSNTAELRRIVSSALLAGLHPEVLQAIHYPAPYEKIQTLVLQFSSR